MSRRRGRKKRSCQKSGRKKEIGETVHTAIAMAIACGVLIMLIGYTMSPTLLRWMGTPQDVLPSYQAGPKRPVS